MFALNAHHLQPKQNELRLERILDPEGTKVEGPLS